MDSNFIEYGTLIIGTLVVTWLLSYIIRRAIDFIIKKNSKQLLVDPTNFIFIKNAISFILYSAAIFWIFTKIPYFATLGKALFASAGVFAAIIGFASQKAFSNIIGGLFILLFKPFSIGDAIETSDGRKGIVEEITLRHTVIKDYEFRRIIVPNNIISNDTIINSSITDNKIRKTIEIGIAYDSDLELAEKLIQEVIIKHPNHIDNRTAIEKQDNESSVPVKVVELGDSSITLRASVWTKDFDSAIELHRDVLRSIKLSFDKNGVEIPFPSRTLVFKNKPNG